MVKYIPYIYSTKYVNVRHVFSYGTHIVILIGGRGIGKTFFAKRYGAGSFLKKGKPFVWVRDNDEARRKLTENKGARFFADFKDMPPYIATRRNDFYAHGSSLYCGDKTMGYIIPSNEFQNDKGSSYADCDIIVFDEFIAEFTRNSDRGRLWKIVNTLSTVMRDRGHGKVLFLANALDRSDPFLALCGFDNIDKTGIYLNRRKDVTLQYFDSSPAFVDSMAKSIVGKLIAGTAYAQNMIHGEFMDRENDKYIYADRLPPRSALYAVLCLDKDKISLYAAPNNQIYVGGAVDTLPMGVHEYVRRLEEKSGDRVVIHRDFLNQLINEYKADHMMFISPHARAVLVNFLK